MKKQQKHCTHEHTCREVVLGHKTGEYKCLDCGYVADRNELEAFRDRNQILKERHPYITRRDQPDKYSHGWQVRFRVKGTDGSNYKCVSKFFADIKHGDKILSLQNALEWRDLKLGGFIAL